MEAKYNLRSPGVKRLMREAKELHQPTHLYYAQPLEDNLFEWHFTVQGPPDSDFAGGRYHGRIILPPEYPMKPPSIMLLTPNGRFETGKKICLSMSAHHPETWQPSWSIRTVLMALIGFMPTQGSGAIGALDYTPQERKTLAKKSLDWKCNGCETCIRTILLEDTGDSSEANKEATELAAQISFKGENEKEKSETKVSPSTSNSDRPTQAPTATISTGVSSQTGASPWTTNSLGPFQPYYATYQPWYPYYGTGYPMYNTGNINPLGGQFGAPSPVAMASQSAAVPSAVSANQVETVPAQASDSRPDNSSVNTLRQRTFANQINQVVSQNDPAGQNVSRTDDGVVQRQPRVTNSSMASLILIWVLAASIAALVCRRLFMISQ